MIKSCSVVDGAAVGNVSDVFDSVSSCARAKAASRAPTVAARSAGDVAERALRLTRLLAIVNRFLMR